MEYDAGECRIRTHNFVNKSVLPPHRHLKEKFREKLGKCKRDGIIQGLVSKGLSRGAGGTNDVDDEENNIISE